MVKGRVVLTDSIREQTGITDRAAFRWSWAFFPDLGARKISSLPRGSTEESRGDAPCKKWGHKWWCCSKTRRAGYVTDSNVDIDVAGGPVRHVPVMLNEVLSCLQLTASHPKTLENC